MIDEPRELQETLQRALGDRYRLVRVLGQGGMGVVFLAQDARHERAVAVKVLRPELARSIGAERFLREIRIAARLNHPNILVLIDSGSAGEFLYYITPFIEGETLRDRLTRERQLPLEDAIAITREVADALSHAHSLGLIHRDIKPENIMFEAGHAIVCDFGIARAVTEAGRERLTETGLAVGTPTYMSPEQAMGDEHLDGRSDMYSLACVAYEMLAGDPPYHASTPQALLARKTLEHAPSLRVVRDTVPPSVEAAITRALARVPADRFATVQQFVDALSGAAAPPGETRRAGWRRHPRRLVLAGVGALAVLGAMVAIGLASHWGGGPAPPLHATVAQVTAEPGVEWFPSLSPDGEWLVYAGQSRGNWDIYLKSVGARRVFDLTENSAAADDQPAFSPDGQRVAFRSSRDGGGIFVMGRTGEGVRRVTRRGFRPTWSPDGAALAYVTENVEINPQNSESLSQLWVVDVASGAERRLDVPDAVLPSWSPHGQRIAFTMRFSSTAGLGGTAGRGGLWSVPPEGGEVVPVIGADEDALDWSPAWAPDGRYLYFVSDRGGSMNLWRVPVDEATGRARGAPQPITTPAVSLAHPALSSDGRHVAYSNTFVTSNIQGARLDAAQRGVEGQPWWVTTGSRRWSSADPSPDGRWVAFYSLIGPEGDVYVARPDGTELRAVTSDSAVDRVPRWSPDGRWIAFFSDRTKAALTLWRVRPDGSELAEIPAPVTGIPVWSPDGTRIVAASGLEPDHFTLVIAVDSGPEARRERLPDPPPEAAGFRPNSWSPDGRRLAGDVNIKDQGVLIYDFATRTYERLTDVGEWPAWLPDGRRLLFVTGGHAFYTVDRVTRQLHEVYRSQRDVLGFPRVTRDGRTMYYSRRVTEGDIWVVTLP
jgi:Tol biopolymer transport system component